MDISKVSVRRVVMWLLVVIIVLLLILTALSYLPASRSRMPQSVALVECRSYYAVSVDGKRLFCFNAMTPDTLLERIDTMAAGVTEVSCSPACWVRTNVLWPFCQGRMVAHVSSRVDSVCLMVKHEGARLLVREMERLQEEEKSIKHVVSEMEYYLSVHNVQDEGYNQVSAYAVKARHDKDSVSSVLALLRGVRHGAKVEAVPVMKFTLLTRDEKGKLVRRPCKMLSQPDDHGFVLLQTDDASTPDGVSVQSLHSWLPWRCGKGEQVYTVGYGGMDTRSFSVAKSEAIVMPGYVTDDQKHLDVPRLLLPDGSAVFNRYGCFLGLACQEKVVETDELAQLLKKGGAR